MSLPGNIPLTGRRFYARIMRLHAICLVWRAILAWVRLISRCKRLLLNLARARPLDQRRWGSFSANREKKDARCRIRILTARGLLEGVGSTVAGVWSAAGITRRIRW